MTGYEYFYVSKIAFFFHLIRYIVEFIIFRIAGNVARYNRNKDIDNEKRMKKEKEEREKREAQEKWERERPAREAAERRLQRERAAQERLERKRQEQERLEQERQERERQERERLEMERNRINRENQIKEYSKNIPIFKSAVFTNFIASYTPIIYFSQAYPLYSNSLL